MARWLVELLGDRYYLEDLSEWFPDGEAFILVEGEKYYMAGPTLERFGDPAHVHSLAIQLIDEFSAVAAVVATHFMRPTVGTIYRENEAGERHGHTFGKVSAMVVRTKMRAKLADTPGPTAAQSLLSAAKTSDRLKTAMLIWADPLRTWPRLYRVLEEIERELGLTVDQAGLCDEDERVRLRRSSNSAEIAGNDARHAAGKFVPPPNPMTLDEATEFVRRMIHGALERKSVGIGRSGV